MKYLVRQLGYFQMAIGWMRNGGRDPENNIELTAFFLIMRYIPPAFCLLPTDELGEESKRSLGVGVIKLVVESEQQAVPQAKALIEQTRNQLSDSQLQQQMIDLVERIVVYKFPQKSREEIEAMFELSDLKQTRVYQEAFAEGEVKLVLRLLNRRIGTIPQNLVTQIQELPVEQIESLGEALLDFQSLSDLVSWLER